MSTATLAGLTVTRCRVSLPRWGAWYAEVELDRPEALSGRVDLVLADATYSGTIVSGAPWQGRARYRIAAGAGAWGRIIPAQDYSNDAGVRFDDVVGDAAHECGETVEGAPETVLGVKWARAEEPASRVLQHVAPGAWYVDEAGVTRLGARSAVAWTGDATEIARLAEQQLRVLAPASIATLVPGAIVDGVEAVDVEHELDDKRVLRSTVWGRARDAAAISRIVESLFPSWRYQRTTEFRVVQQRGERLDLQPVRASSGLADVCLAPVRLPPGLRALWALGSRCLVTFVDGDPAQPVVIAGDDPSSPGWLPRELVLDAGATVGIGASASLVELGSGTETPPPANPVGRVIRYGDTIALPPPISADYVLVPGNVPMGVSKVRA